MSRSILEPGALRRALAIRDLTDPSAGPHAMQIALADLGDALARAWGAEVRVHRASPLVSVEDNYDRLHYPEGGAARDARYTRYANERTVLRTQTSAMIPPLLRALGRAHAASPSEDALLVCPGLVYRRDAIDRLHTGEPHQVDLWRIRAGAKLGVEDLRDMIARVVAAALPGWTWRVEPASHPYTTDGLQIDARDGAAEGWIEIGECGLALPALLAESGLDPARWSGLAMGLGLDRIVMLRKGLDDIRLLRAEDPRVASQMLDLSPYRSVSQMPPVRRDLSIAVDEGETAEELGDRVRTALGPRAAAVEAVEVVAETPAAALPPAAAARLGIGAGQKNVLLRVVLRDLERTLTHAEANELRDAVYAAVHRGTVWHWASGHPPPASV
jgi:phenylalanyl-tRNA synthetase alpha chain